MQFCDPTKEVKKGANSYTLEIKHFFSSATSQLLSLKKNENGQVDHWCLPTGPVLLNEVSFLSPGILGCPSQTVDSKLFSITGGRVTVGFKDCFVSLREKNCHYGCISYLPSTSSLLSCISSRCHKG